MEFPSSRKLKTYGRASRNIAYSPLQRPAPERHDRVTSPAVKDAGAAGKSRNINGIDVKTPRRLFQSEKAESGTVSLGAHTPVRKTDNDIYDIPDDETHNIGSERKRRKLETPKSRLKSQPIDHMDLVTRPRPPQLQSAKVQEARKSSLKTGAQGDAKRNPPVEVVIRTPPSAKTIRTTQFNRDRTEQMNANPPRSESRKRSIPTRPNRPSQRDLNSISRSASSHGQQPPKPLLSRTPSQKLKEMTEHLTTESYFSLPLKRSLFSEERSTAGTPATPSRMRLIDALNTRDTEESDGSSDSDAILRSDQFRCSRTNSRASSNEPLTGARPADTYVNPRRRKLETSSELQQNSSRVTYARQRSFLTQNDMDAGMTGLNGMASKPESQGDPLLFDLGTSLLPPKIVPNLHDDDDNEAGNGSVRSIYELRRAGGNARYQAVIESIFEDLEDQSASTSRKRSGFVQLCSKLSDPDFARRFISNSLEKRLSLCTVRGSDIICKYLVSSLRDLSVQLRESKLWPELVPGKISPQNVALRSLELAVRKVREAGDRTARISNSILEQVVELVLQHSLEGAQGDLFVLEMTFSILESYTVGLPSLDGEQEKMLKRLSEIGLLLSQLVERSDAGSRQIQILQIRLILNITNNNPILCDDFATPDLIGALARLVLSNYGTVAEDLAGDKKESLLDTVILALGTLINLTEWSGRSRGLFLQMTHGSTVLVDKLMELFAGGLKTASEADSVAQTHSNVAFGYLSVLLSTLCLADEVRAQVRGHLRGNNLGRLLVVVEEFLHYYRKVEEELKDPVLEEDAMSGFTTRLQGIVDRIREAEGMRR
ncbi:predicted protein [Uncinocarpus reesii 1704]|uniref:Wings apart-like protein C-terminal domain-containing protein n=1 Tax=Uncinocarpus reesii (strain UAMH 1704) TaxID=336963 RepID=C4JMJ0_UNCRE|nr:uncharacterized protein UREG_04048 [Uncinocarpus reesii 1704]EEP79202.1 predicted protein [Uncinocarpus reesii 1704]